MKVHRASLLQHVSCSSLPSMPQVKAAPTFVDELKGKMKK